jgi:hypothetical protein
VACGRESVQVKYSFPFVTPYASFSLLLLYRLFFHIRTAFRTAQCQQSTMFDTVLQGVIFAVGSLTTSYIAIVISSLVLFCLLTASLHRLYFHPLSAHPGPLLARLTPLPDLYHAYRGDKHIHFLRLHAKYGSVVRFAPNSLSVNDPAALRAIYGHGANVQKSETFYHAFRAHPAAISTLLATEKGHHARKRRIMGQAFSDGAMRDLEQYVLKNVRLWESEVGRSVKAAVEEGKTWTAGVDMGKWCNYLVFGECDVRAFFYVTGCLTVSNRHHGRFGLRKVLRNAGCDSGEQECNLLAWPRGKA